MAVNNIKEFNIEWALFGLLFFCLMSFAVTFMFENNPDGLGSASGKFDNYSVATGNKLVAMESSANSLLNISAQNNPEVSDQGSKDSVATSYGLIGNAKSFLDKFKLFMGWVVTGPAGEMLVTVLVGMFSISALYWAYKSVRQGA